MATLDPNAVNNELKAALEESVKAEIKLLNVRRDKSFALEGAKMSAAAKPVERKSPSEAACERVAKNDPKYLKLCDAEIEAVGKASESLIEVEYLRNKFQIALKG